MKLLAPLMIGATMGLQLDNIKQITPEGTTAFASFNFDGAAGRVKVWNTDAGEAGGYVEIRQLGISEIDADGKEVENFPFASLFEWDPFVTENGDSVGERQYSTQIMTAKSFPRQFFMLQVVVSEFTQTFVTATPDYCNSQYNDCSLNDPAQGDCDPATTACGCKETNATTGEDLGRCFPLRDGNRIGCDRNDSPTQRVTYCTEETTTFDGQTTLNFAVRDWDLAATGNHLRYTAEIKSRLNGEEAKKGNKQEKKGKWVVPIGLEGGGLLFQEFANITHADGTVEQRAVTVSDPVFNGQAAVITIDFPAMPADSNLEYFENVITLSSLDEATGNPATVIVSSFATVGALFAALF